jgi:pyruvate-ferredoxin/flavodoxin oxidoreductase
MALTQAQRVRDSRGAPEFVFNPRLGETYQEALDLKGNPSMEKDWYETKFKATNEPYRYTVAHWCATEARFRNHLKKIKKEEAEKLIPLENMLVRVTQQDVVYRRYLVADHLSYIPDFGVYIKVQGPKDVEYRSLSRQLVMFCVERRKAWRMLQSKAGVENKEYQAQRAILADVSAGKISREDFFARAEELMNERIKSLTPEPPKHATPAPAAAAKPAAVLPQKVNKAPAMEPPKKMVAVVGKVTIQREPENEGPEWEQRVQVRLMELDVDPGNDADRGVTESSEK